MKVYGIKNCDTVKKALKRLEKAQVNYEFIDFKKNPPTKELILRAKEFLGELPVNKRGTTFRKIKEDYESASGTKQINLLLENSSAIRRPLIEDNKKIIAIGIKEEWDFID